MLYAGFRVGYSRSRDSMMHMSGKKRSKRKESKKDWKQLFPTALSLPRLDRAELVQNWKSSMACLNAVHKLRYSF